MEPAQAEDIVQGSPYAVNGSADGAADRSVTVGSGSRDTTRSSRGWQSARGVLLATKATSR